MCVVCDHPNRLTIDTAALSGASIDQLAKDYKIDYKDLRDHCLLHLRLPDFEEESAILGKVKAKELLLLQSTAMGFFLTVKALEKRIHQALASDGSLRNSLPKSLVDLYLGAGSELRSYIDSMFKNMAIVSGKDPTQDPIVTIADLIRQANGGGSYEGSN